jgi:hypothetical protein
MGGSRPSPGPMALLSDLVADRGYANYDIAGPSPRRQYVVTIYEAGGAVAWVFKGTIAELQAMIFTVPRG